MIEIPLLVLVVGFPIWGMICNHRTFKQRLHLIEARSDDYQLGSKWDGMVAEFDQVTYNQHCWALIFLRDPKKLYGPLTKHVMGWV